MKVFESEVIKDSLNPTWKIFQIPLSKLESENGQSIKIECWDWEKSG